MLVILIELFDNPDIVFIRVFIITETRDFLLTGNRALNIVRVKVGAVRNVLETNLVLETDFVTRLFVGNLRRDNNPGAVFVRITFDSENL